MERVLLVSDSFIIREGLKNLFIYEYKVDEIIERTSLEDVYCEKLKGIDLVFIDIKEHEYPIIYNRKRFPLKGEKDAKVIILDSKKNHQFFLRSINMGIDAYLLDIEDKEELVYKINQVLCGGKYYDTDLLPDILKESFMKEEGLLSRREREVIKEIQAGNKNKEIGLNLGISEYTVKRHISNIFKKLDVTNKQELLHYMNIKHLSI